MSTIDSGQSSSAAPGVVELHFGNRDGKVRVVPPDRDIMILSVGFAMEACRAFSKQMLFKNQFDQLLEHLAVWLSERGPQIESAFLTTRDSGLLFLIVQTSEAFDESLEDAITELDLAVANDEDFSLIRLAVHALPRCQESTYRSFLARNMTLRYVQSGP